MSCAVTGRRLVHCLSCPAWRRWAIARYVLSWRITISLSQSIFRTRRLPKRDGTNCRLTSCGFRAVTTPPARCPGKRSTRGRWPRSSGRILAADERGLTRIRIRFALIRVHLRLILFRKRENRSDVDRHVLELLEGLLHRRSDYRKLIKQRFRLIVRSFGLKREQVVRELSHSGFNLRVIDAERAFRFVELYRAFVSEIVELHGHATPVCFRDSETHRAKHAGQISYVKRPLHALVDDAMVDHVLECPQSRHVSLRFFDRGVKLLQLLANRSLLAANRDVVWSKAVHQLV